MGFNTALLPGRVKGFPLGIWSVVQPTWIDVRASKWGSSWPRDPCRPHAGDSDEIEFRFGGSAEFLDIRSLLSMRLGLFSPHLKDEFIPLSRTNFDEVRFSTIKSCPHHMQFRSIPELFMLCPRYYEYLVLVTSRFQEFESISFHTRLFTIRLQLETPWRNRGTFTNYCHF